MNQKNLVGVAVAIILGGTMVYFLTAQKSVAPVVQTPAPVSKNIPTAEKTNPVVQNAPVAPAGQDETAGWNTYTNAKYGFEFKYPKGYAVDEYGTKQVSGASYKFELININPPADAPGGFIMHIAISSDPNILVGPDDREIKEEKLINGIKFAGFSDPGMGDRFGYTTKYGNQYYQLDAVFDTGLFDKILSTFRFTN